MATADFPTVETLLLQIQTLLTDAAELTRAGYPTEDLQRQARELLAEVLDSKASPTPTPSSLKDIAAEIRAERPKPDIHARIETERTRLRKALAVLDALVYTANHDGDVDAGDVAAVARDLVDQAMDALDAVALKGGAS